MQMSNNMVNYHYCRRQLPRYPIHINMCWLCVFLHHLSRIIVYFQMAQLPEGITELLHHEKLPVPFVSDREDIVLYCEFALQCFCFDGKFMANASCLSTPVNV